MRRDIVSAAELHVSRRRNNNIWKRIVSGLAAMIVFFTTYSLILPALTLEAATSCGMIEHIHGEGCYTSQRVLVCVLEESLPDAGHAHGEECYEVSGEHICELEEAAPTEGHIHDDDCFETETTLTCLIPEHRHTDECYIKGDPTADLETPETMAESVAFALLTGDLRADIVAVAETQLGTTVSDVNYIVDEYKNVRGYSRYGAWAGEPYGDWNLPFVGFVYSYAGASEIPSGDAYTYMNSLGERYHAAGSSYAPMLGDVVFIASDAGYGMRVGILTQLIGAADFGGAVICIIEATADGVVAYTEIAENDPSIIGYGEPSGAAMIADEPIIDETIITDEPNIDEPVVDGETAPVADNEPEITDDTDTDIPEMPETDAESESEPETEPETETITDPEPETDADPEIPNEPETAVPDAIDMPAADFNDWIFTDGVMIHVSVAADEGALPAGSQMVLTSVRGADYIAAVSDAVEGEVRNIYAVDISFVMPDGAETEPMLPLRVRMTSDVIRAIDNVDVVHISDEGEAAVMEQVPGPMMDGTVEFEAGEFSVYAIVDSGDTGDYARMTVEFYGYDGTLIATMYVKNSDTLEELENILYDPGVGTTPEGKIFKGWIQDKQNYTTDDAGNGKSINAIREWAESKDITEDEAVKFYAMFFKAYNIEYKDSDGISLGGESKIVADTDTFVTYTINMAYTPPKETQNFEGWFVNTGSSNIQNYIGDTDAYTNGTEIQIKGDVTFSVNAPEGHWLIFDENGKGATYNAPRFVRSGDVTNNSGLLEMTRFGYTFRGWYTDKECTDGNEFSFGNTLSDNTTIYAKWTSVATANYTVIIWKEKSGDTYANNAANGKTREYDFWKAYNFTGNVGDIITAVSDSNTRTTDVNGSYYDVRVQGRTEAGTNVNDVVSEIGLHAVSYDTGVTIVPEGTSIVNVYYDRHTVTYTFYYPVTLLNTYTVGTSDSAYYGYYNKNYIRIYKANNGKWYRTNNNGYLSNEYTGYRYTRDVSWSEYRYEIGLYGEKLNWPTDTSIFWKPEPGSNGTPSGTRMTYKDDFIPTDADMAVEYYGYTASGAGSITFYLQDITGGDNYTAQEPIRVSATSEGYQSVSFTVNDKFSGFAAYQYRYRSTSNGSWTDWLSVGTKNESTGFYGSSISYGNDLEIRYNRLSNTIVYMDGVYVDGNGNSLSEDNRGKLYETDLMFYETDLTSYNKDGTNYYIPTSPAGYVFEGWYADEACTQEYNFTTMPVSGVTVYTKWRQIQYRVFLHPNADDISDLDWGSDDQTMNFRISYGGKVSTPTGYDRSGNYEFIGWYSDAAMTQVFNADAYVLNESTVTSIYDKTIDYTDIMDKYGNGATYNSDIIGYNGGDRFWITKKLDLYAKWRAVTEGAPGIKVHYNANGGTNPPNDPITYFVDGAEATAGAASTPPSDDMQFMYWVVQKWDETSQKYIDTDTVVYPGDTFKVLKAYAKVTELDEEHQTETETKRYDIMLRAEYGEKTPPAPTHINWFANYGTEDYVSTTDNNSTDLQINKAFDIKPADTFKRDGYKFIGWARLNEVGDEGGLIYNYSYLDEDDLYLVYHYDTETWTVNDSAYDPSKTVTQVAADEKSPYHGMYAVWKPVITLKKVDDKGVYLPGTEFDLQVKNELGKYIDVEGLTGKSVIESGVIFDSLSVGKVYKLVETKTPDGYIMLSDGVEFELTKDDFGNLKLRLISGSGNAKIDDKTNTLTVINLPGVSLPSTGGVGTRAYISVGMIMIICAGAVWGVRRRIDE